MSAARVVVTGLGLVSPLGLGRDDHFRRLYGGESGVGPAPENARYRSECPLVAEVQGFQRRSIRTRMLRKLLTRSAAFAVVAAGEALRDAGVEDDSEALRSAGLYAGSVCIDFDPEIFIPALKESMSAEGQLDIYRFAQRGIHLIDPLFLVKTLPNGGIGGIAIEHQVIGPSLNITNGTVSGLQAVILAANAIRTGEAELMLTGGCDTLITMDSIAEHVVSGRVATDAGRGPGACRPFDQNRGGYVLGEGAAFLVLEAETRARARGATVYGEILGGGQTTIHQRTARPETRGGDDPEGLADAAARALAAADCLPLAVDAVCGDGMAVEEADLMEAGAMTRLFDERQVPLTAANAALGFTGAASGTFSLAHALEALGRGVLPPTINCDAPDPRCALDLVRQPREMALERVLVWNSDRGVKNAAVLVGTPR